MDPAIVGSSQFGQLFQTALPGNYKGYKEQIFSQPLVYTPSGGEQQYVYFSTTQNNVYKLHAQTGAIVASRSLHIPFLTADLDGCVDINPTIGIIGTGVIDPATDTLYLTTKTYVNQNSQDPQGRPAGRYFIHALNVNDLTERPNFPINLEGTVARNNPGRVFNGGILLQRPALLQTGDFIYAGFGSHCVQYEFTGWIIGFNKVTGELVERYATMGQGTRDTVKGASIWMSGGGLASDNAGSIFFATGNGYASQLSTIPVSGFNPPSALEQAAVHMTQNDDGSLNIVDFFMPHEKQELDGADKDLGTSPVQILPSEFSCGAVSRMGVVTGKSGKTYWLNLDDLGGYRNGPNRLDKVIQTYQNENSVYAGAGVYPGEGGYIYINVIQYPTHVFKFSCNNGVPSFARVADTATNNAYILGVSHGTVTTLDGQPGTGLLWNTDVQGQHLRIYDAVPQDGVLKLIKSFQVPGTTKFGRAVFGDGIMYMGTTQGLVYGFGAPTKTPINCTAPVAFGEINISEESAARPITCEAVIGVTINGVGLDNGAQYTVSGLPTTPLQLTVGQKFTVNAKFAPSRVGLLSDRIVVNTTNSVTGYSTQTSVRLSGTGSSAGPLLSLSPSRITFQGVITSDEPSDLVENVILSNQGKAALTVESVLFSTESADGPFQTWNGEGSLTVGKFTVGNLPATIAASGSSTLAVRFDSSTSGTFKGFVRVVSNGGNVNFAIEGSAGPAPIALVEFQTTDGEGWVELNPEAPFTFGEVLQNTARSLRMRVTNAAPAGGVRLSLTVSKPPFGLAGIIRAANQVDLAEGTTLAPGESASAVISCSVPKSQYNVEPFDGTATWTMNTNDATFTKNIIEFACKAVSQQAPPLLESGVGKYQYIGCFKENNPGRQLETQIYGNAASENVMCINACAGRNVVFCGSQYRRECWGGNKIPTLRVSDNNCNFDCIGDLNQICGGNGAGTGAGGSYISLFADMTRWDGNYTGPVDPGNPDPGNPDPGNPGTPNPGAPVENPGVAGYASLGCYTEATTGRALPVGKTLTTPTVANCVAACAADSYTHAGVEYASECWCGNALGTGAVPAASGCSLACKGNSTELCGGASRLNIYKLGELPSSSSSSSSTTVISTISTSTSSTVVVPPTTSSTVIVPPTTSSTTVVVPPTTSTTSTTAAPTATGPAVKETVGNWDFQGCYMETETGRALSGKTLAQDLMTLEMCGEFCAGFNYFGVEYGRECYCGNTLREGSVPATNQKDCSFLCPGDKSTYCGAGMRLQMYKIGETRSLSPTSIVASTSSSSSITSAAPTTSSSAVPTTSSTSTTSVAPTTSTTSTTSAAPTTSITSTSISSSTSTSISSALTTTTSTIISSTTTTTTTSARPTTTGPVVIEGNTNFTYYSCVQEPSRGRLLPRQLFNDGVNMTIPACLERCWNFNYAGVEYGRECWCGDALNLVGEVNNDAVPGKNVTDSQCSFLCPGDNKSYCGAGSKMSLYVRKDYEQV